MFNIKFPDKLLDGATYFFFLFPSYAFDVIPCYTFKRDRDMNDKLFYRMTALISGCSCGINFGMLLRDTSSAEKEIFINLLQTQLWLIYQHTANGISSSNGISVTDETLCTWRRTIPQSWSAENIVQIPAIYFVPAWRDTHLRPTSRVALGLALSPSPPSPEVAVSTC